MSESQGTCKDLENEYKLLQKFIKSFYKGSHNIHIMPQDVNLMTWDWQRNLLDSTVNSTIVQKYPVNGQFVRLFLKKIINSLEGKQDIHDEFYSHLCSIMNNGAKDDFCYRHYLINNETEIITIKETNKMVVNGTTGMRTWEAALMLADWALCNKEKITNKAILELGSGVGFTGITIAKLCQPQSMYLTDCHPDVMKTIFDNIKINFPHAEATEVQDTILFKNNDKHVGAMPLDWNSIEELPENIIPDVLIGADIVYDPSILQPLCDVFKFLFSRNIFLEVYITSVIRNEETFESFLKCLDNMNFSYQKLHMHKSVYIEWDQTIQKCMLQIGHK